MSLFDDDLFKMELIPDPSSYGCALTSDDLFLRVQNRFELDNEDTDALHQFYKYHLFGDGLISLTGTLMAGKGVEVIIKNDEKVLLEGRSVDYPINPYIANDGRILILGEYNIKPETIILYINNIRLAAGEKNLKSSFLLISVFAHELYHAYFHKNQYIQELEEPMVEYGSLLYVNSLRILKVVTEDSISGLTKMIQEKKDILRYYSIGSYMFQYTAIYPEDYPQYIAKFKEFDLSRVHPDGNRVKEFENYKNSPNVDNLIAILK